jgi:hypothetical protein
MWREIVEKQEQHPEAFVDEGTPLMKLMMPTTRPSSTTRTTSFDLRLARHHRG